MKDSQETGANRPVRKSYVPLSMFLPALSPEEEQVFQAESDAIDESERLGWQLIADEEDDKIID